MWMWMWFAEHSAYIVLFLVVGLVSAAWCWLLAKESDAQEERDEEMAKRMVELCESYDYRANTFK